MNIRKKDSTAIVNSLSGGVVPHRGLEYIMVGRKEEAQQILRDLDAVANGSSLVKFFIGPFGSGKSFIQALIGQIAFKKQFVVANADFTPDRRLYATDGKAVALYSELVKNLSVATVPDGNALPTILDRWISDIQAKVARDKGYGAVEFNDPGFARDVELEIIQSVSQMDELRGGYDFSRILSLYLRGYIEGNSELQRSVLRWLRGEYHTKTEARSDLHVSGIINDGNYYEYLKVITQFVRQIGYAGLVINFDEFINVYKINSPRSRDKNYETVLKIYNDTLQGSTEGLYITFSGTDEVLEDERKGLFSYGALKRRLQLNKFETQTFRDLIQPVIKLIPLGHEEIYVLLQKLRDIHGAHFEYESTVKDEEILEFIKREYSRPGAQEYLTVGDVIRDFLGAMDILYQNPSYDRKEIFGVFLREDNGVSQSLRSRFQNSARLGR